MPRVSIVVPVFDSERYLRPCLDSVLGQTLGDLELIVVDDRSADATPTLLAEYAREDKRVRVVLKDHNEGVGPTRNVGLQLAEGEYLLLLDGDDSIASPEALETMVAAATQTGADVVRGGRVIRRDLDAGDGHEIFTEGLEVVLFGRGRDTTHLAAAPELCLGTSCWQLLVRREHLVRCGIRFELPWSEDRPFVCWNLLTTRAVTTVATPLISYRWRFVATAGDASVSQTARTLRDLELLGQNAHLTLITYPAGPSCCFAPDELTGYRDYSLTAYVMRLTRGGLRQVLRGTDVTDVELAAALGTLRETFNRCGFSHENLRWPTAAQGTRWQSQAHREVFDLLMAERWEELRAVAIR